MGVEAQQPSERYTILVKVKRFILLGLCFFTIIFAATVLVIKKDIRERYQKVNPAEKISLKDELEKCLPMSNMKSKEKCDQLIATINSFEDCAAAGFPISESYPEQCRTPDGRTFKKF
jgi:hypothetical protein